MAECRFCAAPLRRAFVDLGMSPLCESFVPADQVDQMEAFYPLHAYVCDRCFLVQVPAYVRPETIFTGYAYFSSYSDSWLEHARVHVETITTRLRLHAGSQVVELGSNDGYLVAPGGVVTIEFPLLARLMTENRCDTIYHEHFSYFSFLTAERIFAAHGLTLFDVEELPTHGGSLRVYGRRADDPSRPVTERVRALQARERAAGLERLETYTSFTEAVDETKRRLLEVLIGACRRGKRIAGYGAPGKGNMLLNYCGICTDFVEYTVDRNPYRHDRFLPGTHIPIHGPEKIRETRPDYVLILP